MYFRGKKHYKKQLLSYSETHQPRIIELCEFIAKLLSHILGFS